MLWVGVGARFWFQRKCAQSDNTSISKIKTRTPHAHGPPNSHHTGIVCENMHALGANLRISKLSAAKRRAKRKCVHGARRAPGARSRCVHDGVHTPVKRTSGYGVRGLAAICRLYVYRKKLACRRHAAHVRHMTLAHSHVHPHPHHPPSTRVCVKNTLATKPHANSKPVGKRLATLTTNLRWPSTATPTGPGLRPAPHCARPAAPSASIGTRRPRPPTPTPAAAAAHSPRAARARL